MSSSIDFVDAHNLITNEDRSISFIPEPATGLIDTNNKNECMILPTTQSSHTNSIINRSSDPDVSTDLDLSPCVFSTLRSPTSTSTSPLTFSGVESHGIYTFFVHSLCFFHVI
jgi:hypothetical protein